MLYGLLLAASISAFEPSWLLIANSQDRCAMQDCSVEVKVSKAQLKYTNKTKGDWTSVYYEEDYFYLDYTKRKKIRDFLNKYPDRKKFIVTGYTDGCGSHQYNKELSRKRADEVSRYVISIRRDAIVEMRWVGEASGEHTIKARRVDVGVSKNERIPLVPPKIIADFYLIDSSGSMNDKWTAWVYAVRYWKPRHARVFVSTAEYIPKGSNIDSIKPSGGTEIWFSYYQILDKMKPGQKLIIISDFDSEVKLSPREHQMILNKARQKGVKVQAIRL